MSQKTVTLWRPVGPKELMLIEPAGGSSHLEYWIPAEELEAFNDAIVGVIEVTHSFGDSV